MLSEYKNGGYLTAFIIAVTIVGFLSGALTIYVVQGADVKLNSSSISEMTNTVNQIGKDITIIKVSLAVLETKVGISEKSNQAHKSE